MWQTLSADVRRELGEEYRLAQLRGIPHDASTQTAAAAIIEVCTAPDSTLGQVVSSAGDTICRYTATGDFRLAATLQSSLDDVLRHPGAHVMASIPCTAGSSWQKLNLRKGGEKQRLRVAELRRDMAALVANLCILATAVRAGGGTIAFEWPRGCSLWREPVVQAFVEEFQLHKVDFDGRAVGLVRSTTGQPL